MLKPKNQQENKPKRKDLVKYAVEQDDVILLNGKYQGYRIRELFEKGPAERDYVAEYLWSLNDVRINRIIRSMLL